MVVWEWGQFSILFMAFLWHLSLLKSVNLWIMLIYPQPAYISEKVGAINMLISEGRDH